MIGELSPLQLSEWLADAARTAPMLLDVREPAEFAYCHIAGSRHVPMARLAAAMAELPDSAAIVCICHHGVRSRQAAGMLSAHGFHEVFNLSGGIDAWAGQVDSMMVRY